MSRSIELRLAPVRFGRIVPAFAGFFALAAAQACVVVPADLPEKQFTAALVDSVAWRGEVLRRVEVRGEGSVDTVPGILTARPVVAVPKTGVEGFIFDTARGGVTQGFRYDPERRRVKKIVLAPEMIRPGAAPALSPDGWHVAYVAVADSGQRAVVRVFPRGRVVATSPLLPPPAPGAAPANEARWTPPDTFEITVGLAGDSSRALRLRGTPRGVLSTDTVPIANR